MRIFAIALILAAVSLATAQSQPSNRRLGIYARPGDLYFSYGEPTCRQKLGLETAKRYSHWCLDKSMSYHPRCSIDSPCHLILSPVVSYCDSQRQGNIDHPGKGYKEEPYCDEVRRGYDADEADAERRQKAYDAYIAQHPGHPITQEEWQKLARTLNGK